jgi:FkbM family methyltransferase
VTFVRMASILAKLIPSEKSVRILKGPLRGRKYVTGAASGPAKGLSIVFNVCEPMQLDFARRFAPAAGICFDIGANVGLYTILLARYSKHVFAFEPLPRNIRYLCRMLELNRIKNATIVPCAVSDSSGLSSFIGGADNSLGRLGSGGTQPIFTVSCDDFVSVFGVIPSLVKIDVEGEEVAVLKGAADLLSRYRPVILLSTHGDKLRVACLELARTFQYQKVLPLNGNSIGTASEFAFMP